MIEWPAYTDPSFAKPFEQQTGCKIHRKDAGTSNQMVALMRTGGGGGGGQYDLVSASGDASLRLIYGDDVAPVNIEPHPGLEGLPPVLQVARAQHGQAASTTAISLQWGPNTLIYNTKKVKPAPTSWASSTAEVQGARSASRTTRSRSPTRRCTCEDEADRSGIKDPYELTKAQFDAAVTLLKQQKPLVKRYWNYASDEIQDFKNGDVSIGAPGRTRR